MFLVNVLGSDDALQYDELESQAQTLESGTTYRVRIGNDSTSKYVVFSFAMLLY